MLEKGSYTESPAAAPKERSALSGRVSVFSGMVLSALTVGCSVNIAQQNSDPARIEVSAQRGLATPFTTADVTSYLRTETSPESYQVIWPDDVPVLCMGEDHGFEGHKDEVIRNMEAFRQRGMTHLALEMLYEPHQETIDLYLKGQKTDQDIIALLEECWGYMPEKYLEMIKAARTLGIAVVCLDKEYPSTDVPRDPKNPLRIDIKEDFKRSKFFEQRLRNERWARSLAAMIKQSPEARIVVYCGSMHVGYSEATLPAIGQSSHDAYLASALDAEKDKCNEILRDKFGIPSVVVTMTTRERVKVLRDTPREDQLVKNALIALAEAAENMNLKEKRTVRLDQDSANPRPADYLMFIPPAD